MTILGGVGAAQAFSSASGGKVYGYNNISENAAITVAPANPSRRKIRFDNPGGSDLFVAPLFTQNVVGTAPIQPSNRALVIANNALGGAYRVFANGGFIEFTGECQGGWQALAVTGASNANPLTVTDSNT